MPLYHYKGFAPDGKGVTGTVEASGSQDAAIKIRAEGIFPSTVSELSLKPRKRMLKASEGFLPDFTRQLSILLSAGVPLVEALQSLADETKGFYRELLITVKDRVSGGSSLYRAFGEHQEVFPQFYVGLVQAGEASGTLDRVLSQLSDFMDTQNAIRAKALAALTYPLLMMGVSITVLSFLFVFVIPKIVKIFRDMKGTLPLATEILIGLSTFLVNYWWLLLALLLTIVGVLRKLLKDRRTDVDRILLRLPGNIVQTLYYSRFARTLGFLIEGGVPVLNALSLSAASVGNRFLEASVLKAEERVAEGQRLASALDFLPPVFIRLLATGEKTGRLAETLNRAADAYEEEFARRVARAMALLEPVMIILMGLVVGFIVLAVLLPMFQLNQLVK